MRRRLKLPWLIATALWRAGICSPEQATRFVDELENARRRDRGRDESRQRLADG